MREMCSHVASLILDPCLLSAISLGSNGRHGSIHTVSGIKPLSDAGRIQIDGV
jgi:hypothetical protein